jgi:threonine/homoserine/homoserine lactone efflux protein
MLTFAAAVFLLIATPGPGVLSAAGVGSAYGFRAGFRYLAGLFLGTNLVSIAVISGLATILFGFPIVRAVLLLASMGYLLFMAGRIAFAGNKIAFIETKSSPGVLSGILLQTINPKAYAVNTTLFTGFAYYPDSFAVETLSKLLILNAIWIPIHLIWLYLGVALNRLNLSESSQSRINIVMASSMLGVVVLASLSSLSGG